MPGSSLTANGPTQIDVEYVVSAATRGSTLRASIGVAAAA
jgi:hypothetical protein